MESRPGCIPSYLLFSYAFEYYARLAWNLGLRYLGGVGRHFSRDPLR